MMVVTQTMLMAVMTMIHETEYEDEGNASDDGDDDGDDENGGDSVDNADGNDEVMHETENEDEGDESDDGGDDHMLPFPTRCIIQFMAL